MKSITEKKIIIKKNVVFQKCVVSGVAAFTLATGIWGFSKFSEPNKAVETPKVTTAITEVTKETRKNTEPSKAVESPKPTVVVTNENSEDGIIIDSEEHLYYDGEYLEYLKNAKESDFDQSFIDIYENTAFICNGTEYKASAIYIVKYDDDSIHLVDANNNKYDLLTGNLIDAKKANFMPFRESSIFYTLYLNGVIKESNITLTNEYANYISSWDGNKHNKTPDLAAEEYADEAYTRRYGGK